MPKVFISYSFQDEKFVQGELVPFLRNNRVETWSYESDIKTAEEWERKIMTGLVSCDWFLLVMSPSAIDSEWVKAEVHWALENRKDRVVPLMWRTCKPADLHLKLLRIQYVDFRGDLDLARKKLLSTWGTSQLFPLTATVKSAPIENTETGSKGTLGDPPIRIMQTNPQEEDAPQLLVDKESAPYHAPEHLYFSGFHSVLVLTSHFFPSAQLLGIWDPTTVSPIEETYYDSLARSKIIPGPQWAYKNNDIFYVTGWNTRSVTLYRAMVNIQMEDFIAVSPKGVLVYDSHRKGISFKTARPRHEVIAEAGTPKVVQCLALSPDLKYMAVGMSGQTIVYNCATGKQKTVIDESAPDRAFQNLYMQFSPDGIFYCYITPKANIHYSGPTNLVLHRVSDWREFRRFHCDKSEIRCFTFSRDGKYVAVGTSQPEVTVFDVDGGEALHRLTSPFSQYGGAYISVAISPDNGFVVASRDSWLDSRRVGALEFWDFRSGQYLFMMDWREGTCLVRFPSGRLNISKGGEKYVGVSWQLQKYPFQDFLRLFPGKCDQQLVSQEEMLSIFVRERRK